MSMKKMTSAALRQTFLDYFASHQHTVVASSALVPSNDPTLLFTNAGMVQFKEVFLGLEKRNYVRATSSQRCVRAGGKHNDLENVGYTARHHTFFEMLGNFSFGDYFKREAIHYAWEFLTKILALPAEKLWVTVYEEDKETADIWLKEMQIDPNRFSRCGAKDNFWAMGETGPCGPCTEIFYDHGPDIAGGPPGSPDADGDRYIEIWNLVFMQFERQSDGALKPLPKPSVDTGMGLERIAAVLQGVHTNYETDLFTPLIQAVAQLAGTAARSTTSLQVIADHIRSTAFLIMDGVLPSNEGRGYVLRRIIRRAIRHGHQLGLTDIFFYKLVAPLAKVMGHAYPQLLKQQTQIETVLQQEETQFARTLTQGLKILETDLAALKENTVIPGTTVFRLYDTYGFPVDLTADIARERGFTVDYAGFEIEMEKQRRQSQAASKFEATQRLALDTHTCTEFKGYDHEEHSAAVVALFREGEPVDVLQPGESGSVILDSTPFYAEAGGQIGDQGLLTFSSGRFRVTDTRKEGQAHIHLGEVITGSIHLHDHVHAHIDQERRAAIRLNHSATHLLHAALRQVLGEHVVQKGSRVAPDRLRFDFAHATPLTPTQLTTLERLVNQKIRENLPVDTQILSADDAMKSGAIALFGEKYGEEVRVLSMGNFSKELCGGTHVKQTGDIGIFKIVSESGIAAGIRRLEAVTGEGALDFIATTESTLNEASQLLKTGRETFLEKLTQSLDAYRAQTKQLEKVQSDFIASKAAELSATIQTHHDHHFIVADLSHQISDPKQLRELVERLRLTHEKLAVLLVCTAQTRLHLVIGIHPTHTQDARELLEAITTSFSGKGGGRRELAQWSAEDPTLLEPLLTRAFTVLRHEDH